MDEKMKIVLLEPEKKAKITEVEHSLSQMQQIVGGCIEATYPFAERVCLVCNDEGKINGMPLNRVIHYDNSNVDVLAGTAFICGIDEDHFRGLTDEEAKRYEKRFLLPEQFFRTPDGSIVSMAFQPIPDNEEHQKADSFSGKLEQAKQEANRRNQQNDRKIPQKQTLEK